MRHRNHKGKLNRTSAHRTSTLRNLCTNLIYHGRIETTVAKAKQVRSQAEKMITIAKKENTLHSKRLVKARLALRHNKLTPKEAKMVKEGNTTPYNHHRDVLNKLYTELAPRFANRAGGYTRIVRTNERRGDAAPRCIVEFVGD